ncbi:MAG: DUF5615 family PIN-like protein [Candidatus Thermoplasmatota archaeon]
MNVCLDENVPDHVKVRLEAEGQDVEYARDVAGQGAPDEELLKLCAQEQRALLTNDRDFDRLHEVVHHEGILRYGLYQQTREGWKKIVRGIDLIDEHLKMRNELQWPNQWTDKFDRK